MQKYKAIISDIDGTLTPLSPHPKLSQNLIHAIKSLKEKNVTFTLATGKPFAMIQHLIDDLDLESPIIVDNGAAIYHAATKKPLWQSVMEKEKIEKIWDLTKKYKKRMRLSNGRESYEIKRDSDFSSGVKGYLMGFTVEEVEDCIKQIENSLKDIVIMKAEAYEGKGYSNLYITNTEATKQHAVLKVAELLNITTKEIIGIGNDYNDFPLMMACGCRVVMENAVPELKEIADYIAPSVEKDGVVKVIKKFIL